MAIRSKSAASAPEHSSTPSGNLTETPTQSTGRQASQSVRRRTRRTRLRTAVLAGTAAVMLAGSSGCSLLSNAYRQIRKTEYLDDFMLAHRNKVFATKAWLREKHCHGNRQHLAEFKAGFLQGYIDVANGSDGCLPCVAPSQYWGWKYQSPGGQAAIDAWFAGYPLGVKAAEQEGVGYWGRAPIMAKHTPDPDANSGELPAEAPMMLGPDGKPIPPEVIVPGSTTIIERTIPNEAFEIEDLDAPVPQGSGIDVQDLKAPLPGDEVSLEHNVDDLVRSESAANQSDAETAAEAISGAVNLVPRQTATVYSLNDLSDDTEALGDDAIEGIFGAFELPENLTAATSKPPASKAPLTPTGESEAAVETASAADDEIPFKFE